MKVWCHAITIIVCITSLLFPLEGEVKSQSNTPRYKVELRPDIWYNSIDGIRTGGIFHGRNQGTIGISPHEFDGGVWVGTRLPSHPISYYISLKEPIAPISSFGQEAYFEGMSSVRTGYLQHKLKFFKRWQPGRDSREFIEFTLGFGAKKRFDKTYLLYPHSWQQQWITTISLKGRYQRLIPMGLMRVTSNTAVNLPLDHKTFVRSEIEFLHELDFSQYFSLRSRLFAGFASNHSPSEYQFLLSMPSPVKWMKYSLFRARGTIPTHWMQSGLIQRAGGPNLRGYTGQDINLLENGTKPTLQSIGTFNIEFSYPNPLNQAIKRTPVIQNFMKLLSYVYWDGGISLGLTKNKLEKPISDAGLGFRLSLNIPNYMNHPRGFFIRYELPLWLSRPTGNDQNLKFRQLMGIGTVFSI